MPTVRGVEARHGMPAPGEPPRADVVAAEPVGATMPVAPPDATAPDDVALLMAEVWISVLGCDEPGEDADFFDLGGDSLLITHLARQLRQRLGIRVPLVEMLANPTLGAHTRIARRLLQEHRLEPAAAGGADG